MNILIVIDGLGIGQDGQPGTFQSIRPLISDQLISKSHTLQAIQSAATTPDRDAYKIVTDYGCADSYMGHFEMMGIRAYTKTVFVNQYEQDIIDIFGPGAFMNYGYVNKHTLISNNIEAEVGTTINVITTPEYYKQVQVQATKLRKRIDANRLIVMTSDNVSPDDRSWITMGTAHRYDTSGVRQCGLVPAKLGMYGDTYRCCHIGRGFGEYEPTQINGSYLEELIQKNKSSCMIGKVCDIFQTDKITPLSRQFNAITASDATARLRTELTERGSEFVFANFQTFDLQCHLRDMPGAANTLSEIALSIDSIIKLMHEEDTLMITADHGNNPTRTDNNHSVEDVPLIIHSSKAWSRRSIRYLRDINGILKESLR